MGVLTSLQWLVLVTIGLLFSSPAWAAAPTEYEVKAAFLFNFTQFVEWPDAAFPEPAAPLIIGVLGRDRFGAALDEIVRGEEVKGHPMVVRRYRDVDEIEACHILFIDRSLRHQLPRVLDQLQGRNILTVGDFGGFAHAGGMINLIVVDQRIRLRVNLDAARHAKLTISSKLLRPAEIVGALDRKK